MVNNALKFIHRLGNFISDRVTRTIRRKTSGRGIAWFAGLRIVGLIVSLFFLVLIMFSFCESNRFKMVSVGRIELNGKGVIMGVSKLIYIVDSPYRNNPTFIFTIS
jgi:hypothetical protein